MPGGHSGEEIPVPIPNTEVKLSYADDTAEKWESRKLPGFFYFKLKGYLFEVSYSFNVEMSLKLSIYKFVG